MIPPFNFNIMYNKVVELDKLYPSTKYYCTILNVCEVDDPCRMWLRESDISINEDVL